MVPMLTILHISDLHFGPPYAPRAGAALLEIGHDQGRAATEIARRRFPHAIIHLRQDLAGRDRLLEITRTL